MIVRLCSFITLVTLGCNNSAQTEKAEFSYSKEQWELVSLFPVSPIKLEYHYYDANLDSVFEGTETLLIKRSRDSIFFEGSNKLQFLDSLRVSINDTMATFGAFDLKMQKSKSRSYGKLIVDGDTLLSKYFLQGPTGFLGLFPGLTNSYALYLGKDKLNRTYIYFKGTEIHDSLTKDFSCFMTIPNSR